MDILRNYPTFRKDIENVFSPLIQEFHLKSLELYDGCYLLKGSKCSLRFTFDRGDISCQFKHQYGDPKAPGFDVISLYRFLYPIRKHKTDTEPNYNYKYQLSGLLEIIQKHFKNVMNGDFSWLTAFLEHENSESKLSRFVLTQLSSDHPIAQKFWGADETWKDDLKQYLLDNNLKIQDLPSF
jgi:hypothetical protein